MAATEKEDLKIIAELRKWSKTHPYMFVSDKSVGQIEIAFEGEVDADWWVVETCRDSVLMFTDKKGMLDGLRLLEETPK